MAAKIPCPNPDCDASRDVVGDDPDGPGPCKKCGTKSPLVSGSRGDGPPSAGRTSVPSPSSPGTAVLPEQFGRYRIMKPLGRGGMGAVYLAHDLKLNRQVALKVPSFGPSDGPQAIQRFEREARAAATLDHPNLCPVYDVGEVDGIHYLTMPYIEGKPLSEAIADGRVISESQAAAVVRKLALALQEAHDKGVIHRDLKPGNIMVNRRRGLIIMDFGLARVADGDDRPVTRTGHVLGTALYMAPEQAAGDLAAGPACDVYSLGVILYELLTGRRPFEGPWSLVIGLKSVKDPDPPSSHRPGLGAGLDAVCLRAIARDPEDRYATMAEFADALGRLGADPPSTHRDVAPSGGATDPARLLEDKAAEVVAGVVRLEGSSILGDGPRSRSKAGLPGAVVTPRSLPIAAGFTLLVLGVVVYFATRRSGPIKQDAERPGRVVRNLGSEGPPPDREPARDPIDAEEDHLSGSPPKSPDAGASESSTAKPVAPPAGVARVEPVDQPRLRAEGGPVGAPIAEDQVTRTGTSPEAKDGEAAPRLENLPQPENHAQKQRTATRPAERAQTFKEGMVWDGTIIQQWFGPKGKLLEQKSSRAVMRITRVSRGHFEATITYQRANKDHVRLVQGTTLANGTFAWDASHDIAKSGEGHPFNYVGVRRGNQVQIDFSGPTEKDKSSRGTYRLTLTHP
jgi:serine/threonine protein kinase